MLLADNNLPMLPVGIYHRLPERDAERLIERLVDIADAQYMSDPTISRETYDEWCNNLLRWERDFLYAL